VAETCISGSSNNADIAELFRDHFSAIYNDPENDLGFVKFKQLCNEYKVRNIDDKDNPNNSVADKLDIKTVEQVVKLLKMNKAAGHDGIVSEHVVHSHPALLVHLKILYDLEDRSCSHRIW